MSRIILFIISFAFTHLTFSQPVIYNSRLKDEGITLVNYQGTSNRKLNLSGGENITWDLSSVPVTMINEVEYKKISFSDTKSEFQDATMVYESPKGSGNFTFLKTDDASVDYLGFVVNEEVPGEAYYQNPWKLYSFPLRYKNIFRDAFTSSSEMNYDEKVSTVYNNADYSYEVNGYGTVITPMQKFENCLRLEIEITGFDSTVFTGDVDSIVITHYRTKKIAWVTMLQGIISEIASCYDGRDFFFQEFREPVIVEPSANQIKSLKIYPDPASTFIDLNGDDLNGNYKVLIKSVEGKIMYEFERDFNSNENRIRVDYFNPGIYMVELRKGMEILSGKFVRLK